MSQTLSTKPVILIVEPDPNRLAAYQAGLTEFNRNYELRFEQYIPDQLKENPNVAVVVYGTTVRSRPNLIQLALRDIGIAYNRAAVILLTCSSEQRVRGCNLSLVEGLTVQTLAAQVKAMMPQHARRS